jgi:transposase-like protein
MDCTKFAFWLSEIGGLDAEQRRAAAFALANVEAMAAAPRGPSAAAAVPAVPALPAARLAGDGPPEESLLGKIGRQRIAACGCPHCGADDICSWGRANGKPRYRCGNCGKTFNALTGTPLAGLHYPERWGDQAQALMEGDTLARAAARCGIDATTAFRWRHRFLAAMKDDKPRQLSGIVEADETFILESKKGKRAGLARKPRRRGGKASKRGLSDEQIPVMVARDRSGATIDAILPHLDAASIAAALGGVISRSAELCCDGGGGITAFGRRACARVHILQAPGGPKPEAPQYHINNVNAYHGRLKEWLRRFHGVATANLANYLSWRRTIEALSTTAPQEAWVMAAAGLGPYQQRSQ